MVWESFGVVRFDLGPLVQGQMRIAKLKSAYNSLIIGPRGLQCETNLSEIMGWKSSDVGSGSNYQWPLNCNRRRQNFNLTNLFNN